MRAHIELIQLIVAYALAGALVFTLVITCLSLLGWVRFASPAQQNKLFYVLIVELVTVAVGFFGGLLRFDAAEVQAEVIRDYMSAPESRALGSDFTGSNFSGSKFSGGNFDNSLFDGASFKNTQFRKADLSGADLSEAITDEKTKLP